MQENDLSVHADVTIAATSEEVWQALTDLGRYRQWHPFLEPLKGPDAAHVASGTVLRLLSHRGTPTEREFDVTVTEVSGPHVLAWEGGDPQLFFGRHRFTLTAVADGTRLVDEEVFSGAMAEAVLGEHRAALAADYQTGAEALKKAVESGQASSKSCTPRPAAP